ncbi:MAG: hypothetical protein GC162_09735 [Planctomycetes bacterium]|nr:hypothetical protein [Planctomycetota bacterium]
MPKFEPNADLDKQPVRIYRTGLILVAGLSLVMFGLLGRVVQLQLDPERRLHDFIENRGSEASILARRGDLTDTRGRPIASTHLGYRLFADPKAITDIDEFAAHVAHAIGDDPARIDQLISRRIDSRYIVINPLLDEAQVKAVQDLKLAGLGVEPNPVRIYHQGQLASQLVGFVGAEHKGLDGVEFALDSLLRGEPGRVHTLRDVSRNPLWIEQSQYVPSDDGRSFRLSVDMVIQSIAEKELAEACRQFKAKRAELIVMEARTGQILAMANWPPFDPNDPAAAQGEARRNRCITDPFEPGSIFKPFVYGAALSTGVTRGSEMYDCTTSGVYVTSYGRRLRDAHAHGLIDFDHVLIFSSNIGMGKVGERMGSRALFNAVTSYGFGTRTGTALPGESPGIVNPLNQWSKYSLTSVPMGQEIAVTPVQMVKAFSAFANGGVIVSPSVLGEEADTPIYQRAISADAAQHTRDTLRRVVTEGTGRKADSAIYRLWGKTGTAQVPDRVHGGYKDRAYNASFICGAPLNNPRLITLVTVHEPDAAIGYYGGIVAAPVAKNVMEKSLTYLGVPPDNQDAPRGASIASAD